MSADTRAANETIVAAYLHELTNAAAQRQWGRAWDDLNTLVVASETPRLPTTQETIHARHVIDVLAELLTVLVELDDVVEP